MFSQHRKKNKQNINSKYKTLTMIQKQTSPSENNSKTQKKSQNRKFYHKAQINFLQNRSSVIEMIHQKNFKNMIRSNLNLWFQTTSPYKLRTHENQTAFKTCHVIIEKLWSKNYCENIPTSNDYPPNSVNPLSMPSQSQLLFT